MTTTNAGQPGERLAALRESLDRVVQPIKEQVAAIDARLADVDRERQDLLAARREAMAVIRAADPEARAAYHAPKKTGGKTKARAGADATDKLFAFLEAHAEDFADGIAPAVIRTHPAFRGMVHTTTIQRALPQLVEDGRLRLDRIGKLDPADKGRDYRIYKLIGGDNGRA